MRQPRLLIAGYLLFLAACSMPTAAQEPATSGSVTLFEGARLIAGDGSLPIERSAFLVENNRFTRVGRKGEIQAPAAAARIDLTGKTVIPALVDAHSHIGYMKDLTSGPQNYTRENILDHMYRFAYYGIAASQAMGSDFGDLPYQLRDEFHAGKYPDAARFLTAGRGLAPEDEVRPDNMRHSAYTIRTEDDVKKAVQELAARNVKIVKTWVDDRDGSVRKLTPDLYRAIINEAHKHNMRVAVHALGLADAKGLLRAGIDIFAHMISDVDDELVELFKQHPTTGILLALGGPRRTTYAPWIDPPHPLVRETVSPEQIRRLRDRLAGTTPDARERARASWDRLASGIRRLSAAGVRIGVGTDGGGQQGDQFIGWTMHTEMENMVAAGMTPAQVLVAATKTSAEILGLDELGLVAAGKSADFVVLDANPVDDITNSRRIAGVYLRGTRIDRARLRAGWTGVAADRYPASGGDIEITPFLHASVQVEHAGKVIQVDPWSVADLSRAKPADLILSTDTPGHHLDVKAIQQLRKPGAPVVITASGLAQVRDGVVLANGESATVAGVRVESIAAYDLVPGAPEHPKGDASGYLITLGGRRIYFAGVTECVPELRALKNIDVAFMPMNIPPARMIPSAAAECVKLLKPKVVYLYHYDQDTAARLTDPRATARGLPGGISVAQSLQTFKDALRGEPIDVRLRDWYLAPRSR